MQEDVAGFSHLVQEGTGILDSDGHGWSALHWASSRGSTVLTYGILQEIKLLRETGEVISSLPRDSKQQSSLREIFSCTEYVSRRPDPKLITIERDPSWRGYRFQP